MANESVLQFKGQGNSYKLHLMREKLYLTPICADHLLIPSSEDFIWFGLDEYIFMIVLSYSPSQFNL